MRFFPIAIVFLVGCFPPSQIPDGHDAGGVDCESNNAPFIANIEMNSFEQEEDDGLYWLSVHFDWADPGVAGAGDRQNMSGGYISGELLNVQFPTVWFTPERLQEGCIDPPEFEGACLESNHGQGDQAGDLTPDGHRGCGSPDDLDACVQGELTFLYTSEAFVMYRDILLEFRVRDRCGDESNFKLVEYEIGSGHLVETPPAADP